VAPVPLYTLSLIFEGPHRIAHALGHLAPGGILALLYVVIVSTAFGFGAWTWLLRRHPASRVAPFTLLVPPVGIAAAWIALGERPGGAELAGALVVLVGLALVTSAVRARPARVSRLPSLETPTL
jgi:O-acetylserine/cysteine efflux transporter